MELYVCLTLSLYGFCTGAKYPWIFQLINLFTSTIFITKYLQINDTNYVDIGAMFFIIWVTTKVGEKIRRMLG